MHNKKWLIYYYLKSDRLQIMWKSNIRMRENANYINLSALLIVKQCNHSVLLYPSHVKTSNENKTIIVHYTCILIISLWSRQASHSSLLHSVYRKYYSHCTGKKSECQRDWVTWWAVNRPHMVDSYFQRASSFHISILSS